MPVESSFVSASQTLKCLPREGGERGRKRGRVEEKERERESEERE